MGSSLTIILEEHFESNQAPEGLTEPFQKFSLSGIAEWRAKLRDVTSDGSRIQDMNPDTIDFQDISNTV